MINSVIVDVARVASLIDWALLEYLSLVVLAFEPWVELQERVHSQESIAANKDHDE